MKTKLQMIEEIKASGAKFVSYGDSELGCVIVPVEDALADIADMDEEMIGNGDWMEHDAA